MPGAWRAETFVGDGVCAECGEPYIARTNHRRLFCTPECGNAAAQRRYRAKLETKALHARHQRASLARAKQ